MYPEEATRRVESILNEVLDSVPEKKLGPVTRQMIRDEVRAALNVLLRAARSGEIAARDAQRR